MATFAKATFDAAAYLAYRPRYPPELVAHALNYHASSTGARWDAAVDLGCGPGQLTTMLASRFRTVVGLDPSKGMVEKGMPAPADAEGDVSYRVGSAEDLGEFEDSSVDLVAAGQAAHWFDHPKVYAELTRVLRPGGSVAYIGYAGMMLTEYPKTRELVIDYTERRLDGYWEPGRKLVDACYDPVPFPTSDAWDRSASRRLKFDVHPDFPIRERAEVPPPAAEHGPLLMKHRWSPANLQAYLNTWSGAHNYDEREGKGADGSTVADRFFEELRSEAGFRDGQEVEVAFPAALLLMRKK